MRASKDGNLREVVIRDPETIFVIAKFARATRRSPNAAASTIILNALKQYRPSGSCIPPNQFWQGKIRTKAKAGDPAVEQGADKAADNGD